LQMDNHKSLIATFESLGQFECQENNLQISGNLESGTHVASISITSDGTVVPNSEIQFVAGQFVQLDPNFGVDQNGVLTISIEACNEQE